MEVVSCKLTVLPSRAEREHLRQLLPTTLVPVLARSRSTEHLCEGCSSSVTGSTSDRSVEVIEAGGPLNPGKRKDEYSYKMSMNG